MNKIAKRCLWVAMIGIVIVALSSCRSMQVELEAGKNRADESVQEMVLFTVTTGASRMS